MTGISSPQLFVDLEAIQRNFLAAKLIVGSNVEVSAVVKSDAYGLGIDQVVGPLAAVGCHSFFVADLEEAIRVRNQLAAAKIYILSSPKPSMARFYRKNDFIPVCNTLEDAATLVPRGCLYALNVETGFSRSGISFGELRTLIHCKLNAPALVMSHLACADDPGNSINSLQKNRFMAMCELTATAPRSLAASAGISLGSAYHFDLVRIGSALYGLNNASLDPSPFVNVVRLRAQVADIRLVRTGESVGYMGTFRACRPTWLGILAIGYSHGLAWSASNQLFADVGSHQVPVVGRIAMEYAAIDMTDLPASLRVAGRWVELLNERLPTELMARLAGTIPQETLIRIGTSNTRQYLSSYLKKQPLARI
ncbi:alanine racemase [Rhizobium sp. Root73]|uniref:alanine racemase n=1 Tax=unclassified Rhizobium TaxID=2613769 RepID=UPI000729A742|nr:MULTISPECIES: alanine racemase [unclassified Rhizobium]KQY15070.1 alanine racemase [Rhizobium sp. Root1334]KRC06593.1 alanine racemase [Rhizobium sp. Root73]